MGKPVSERNHKKQVDASNKHKSSDTIRQGKNQTAKSRNSERREKIAAKLAMRVKLSPAAQLKKLDSDGLTAKRERAKLKKLLV